MTSRYLSAKGEGNFNSIRTNRALKGIRSTVGYTLRVDAPNSIVGIQVAARSGMLS
jgi:hypothetical protein